MSRDSIIARMPFTDGAERAVFGDAEGRQYVRADQGGKVFGVWAPPADEPVLVTAPTE
jgi:hypothetical protein